MGVRYAFGQADWGGLFLVERAVPELRVDDVPAAPQSPPAKLLPA